MNLLFLPDYYYHLLYSNILRKFGLAKIVIIINTDKMERILMKYGYNNQSFINSLLSDGINLEDIYIKYRSNSYQSQGNSQDPIPLINP